MRRRMMGPRRACGATGAIALLCGVGVTIVGTPAAGAAPVAAPVATATAANGSWSVTSTPSDVRAVHVTLLRTGKVLLVAGSGNSRTNFDAGTFKTSVWDPSTGNLTAVSTPWDAFCAGHVTLADGRVLVAGGTSAYSSPATNSNPAGSKKAYVFDPTTQKYTTVPDMHLARWYPTLTELGDGRVLALGGLDQTGHRTSQFETFNGAAWSAPANGPSNYVFQPMYPALHQMRDGRLFYSGVNTFGGNAAEVPPGLWDITNNAYTSVPGLTDDGRRDQGASVLLPPAQDQRVMVIGGGEQDNDVNAVSSTAIADLKAASPSFTPGPPISSGKMYVNAVVLPDSTVFETGGGAKSVTFSGAPVLSAQIFHPKTNAWTTAASPSVARLYHSSAVLLPDGRVATFGSNPTSSFEMRIEIFTPPYLQTGTARPTVTGAAADLHYGDYASFATTQSAPITSAVLVRPASTTHQSDPNQRLIDVGFAKTATGVSVTMPTERNLAPPGWYMMFVVDAKGVPSVAKWIHLDGAGVKPNGGYVLDGFGGLHSIALAGGAAAPTVNRGPYWSGWDIARAAARRPNHKSGYVLDAWGGVHPFASGTAALPPAVHGNPYWSGWDIARGIAILPNGSGGYVVDGFGGIHRFRIGSGAMPPAVSGAPYWNGQDRARGITVLPDGSGGYVVDSTGTLYPFRIGSGGPAVPAVAGPYPPGAAPVRGAAVQPNGAAGFVLDGFGGLHGFAIAGGVPLPISGAPSWPGWVIARNLAI